MRRQHPGERVELERREHHVLHGRGLEQRRFEDREHRHRLAASRRLGLRDHDLRLARLQPLRDRRRGEPGEDRHLHRADVRARVRGDRDLGRHRQEDRDAVALADAEPHERLGEARHVARELGERQLAAGAVLAEADRCDPPGVRSAQRWTQLCAIEIPSRRRTTSSTRARASRRAPRPTAARTRARDPRRRAARTRPGPPASGARARRSRRRRPGARAGSRLRARSSPRRASRQRPRSLRQP